MLKKFSQHFTAQSKSLSHIDKENLDRYPGRPALVEQVTGMNFYAVGKLCRRTPENRLERLAWLKPLTELPANEVNQVWFARNEAVVRIDVTARGPRIGPHARSEAAGRCAAKGAKVDHSSFATVGIARELIEQLPFFQAEHP